MNYKHILQLMRLLDSETEYFNSITGVVSSHCGIIERMKCIMEINKRILKE